MLYPGNDLQHLVCSSIHVIQDPLLYCLDHLSSSKRCKCFSHDVSKMILPELQNTCLLMLQPKGKYFRQTE